MRCQVINAFKSLVCPLELIGALYFDFNRLPVVSAKFVQRGGHFSCCVSIAFKTLNILSVLCGLMRQESANVWHLIAVCPRIAEKKPKN